MGREASPPALIIQFLGLVSPFPQPLKGLHPIVNKWQYILQLIKILLYHRLEVRGMLDIESLLNGAVILLDPQVQTKLIYSGILRDKTIDKLLYIPNDYKLHLPCRLNHWWESFYATSFYNFVYHHKLQSNSVLLFIP